jgi:hypothetical protein
MARPSRRVLTHSTQRELLRLDWKKPGYFWRFGTVSGSLRSILRAAPARPTLGGRRGRCGERGTRTTASPEVPPDPSGSSDGFLSIHAGGRPRRLPLRRASRSNSNTAASICSRSRRRSSRTFVRSTLLSPSVLDFVGVDRLLVAEFSNRR